VPAHAELHLLLSMITPMGWLERVPSYKDQQEKLKEKDLATYGFLGYPLLQSCRHPDLQAPAMVPVGADQVAHVELTREVARRFNHIYGRELGFEDKVEEAAKKMGKKNGEGYSVDIRSTWQETRRSGERWNAARAARVAAATSAPAIANVCWVTWKAAARSSCPSRRRC
jgi:tryptophanyl-tRNA synthetase